MRNGDSSLPTPSSRAKMHDSYKLWSPQPDPATVAKCPICNSRAEVWQFSDSPDSQLMRVVMCTQGEAFGPQIKDQGTLSAGCILYMPPDDFYRATTKEAVRYWNEYARALLAARSERVPLEGHTATRWKVSARQGYEVTLFFDNLDNMEAFLSLIGRKEEQHG